MFAVVQIGANQYKVSEGDVVEAGHLDEENGKDITLENVLLYVNGETVKVGQPYLKDVKVTAHVAAQTLGEKVFTFKFRRRKNSARKRGYRKKLTVLNIKKIAAGK